MVECSFRSVPSRRVMVAHHTAEVLRRIRQTFAAVICYRLEIGDDEHRSDKQCRHGNDESFDRKTIEHDLHSEDRGAECQRKKKDGHVSQQLDVIALADSATTVEEG